MGAVIKKLLLCGVALAFIATSVTGCSSAIKQPHKGEESVNLHAIKDMELKSLMQKINSLVYEQEKPRLDSEAEIGQKIPMIITTAHSLASAVAQIKETGAANSLSQQNRTIFITLADKLKMDVLELETAAQRKDSFGVVQAHQQMLTTCDACHTLFRGKLQ